MGSIAGVALGLAIVLAVVLLARTEGQVHACSCAATSPSVADDVGGADIAFVGQLVSHEVLDPPARTEWDEFDLRYEFVVDEAVKGVEDGDLVVMFGSTTETSCGTSELIVTTEPYAIVATAYDGRFVADSTPMCSRPPTVTDLRTLDRTLPATSPGPVSLVIAGRVGEAELVAYDASGRPVAYADLPVVAGRPAICPSSSRLVQLEQSAPFAPPLLVVRDVATLDVVDRRELTSIVSADIGYLLTSGADLTCRSPSGDDVVALLSWENSSDGRTRVVHVARDEESSADLGHASRATYDIATNSVVAMSDGALVRIGPSGEDRRDEIAQLTSADTRDFDALFIEPDGAGGWWVGLGDGDYEMATRLRLLAHVAADGSVEVWSVSPTVDAYGATLSGTTLRTYAVEIELPAIGSSASGAVVAPASTDPIATEFALSDGRSVRFGYGEDSRIELVGADGSAVILAHLAEPRSAVAVVDGPLADPAAVVREPETALFESPWITRAAAPKAATTSDATPDRLAPTDPDSTSLWPWAALAGLALTLIIAVVARARRANGKHIGQPR